MDEKIKKILNDLYKSDPRMKDNEKELIKLIDYLIKNKPETKFDEKFSISLKNELNKISSKNANRVISFKFSKKNIFKVIYFFSGGLAMFLVFMVGIPIYNNMFFQVRNSEPSKLADFSMTNKVARQGNIKNIEDNAFGDFLKLKRKNEFALEASLSGAKIEESEAESYAQDSMVGVTKSNLSDKIIDLDKPDDIVERKNKEKEDSIDFSTVNKEIEPGLLEDMPKVVDSRGIYSYEYVGEDIKLNNLSLPVYSIVRDQIVTDELNKFLKSIELDLVDFYAISAPLLGSIEVVSNVLFGHVFHIDFMNKQFTITPYNEKWPQEDYTDPLWWKKNDVLVKDLPKDETLIKMANQFLDQHSISRENYESPMVDNRWRMYVDNNDKEDIAPNHIYVRYPQSLNGYRILDMSEGEDEGITVSIDMRHQKVAGVSDLHFNSYLASEHPLQDNVSEIMKEVKKGGYYNKITSETISKGIVKLNTPYVVYTRFEDSELKNNLLIPCYYFPVVDGKKSFGHREFVLVPLIKNYYK